MECVAFKLDILKLYHSPLLRYHNPAFVSMRMNWYFGITELPKSVHPSKLFSVQPQLGVSSSKHGIILRGYSGCYEIAVIFKRSYL